MPSIPDSSDVAEQDDTECSKPDYSKSARAWIKNREFRVKDHITSYYAVSKPVQDSTVIKGYDSFLPGSTMSKLNSFQCPVDHIRNESMSVKATETSLDGIRSSPVKGCSIYDVVRGDSRPSSSSESGHRFNRVASRKLDAGIGSFDMRQPPASKAESRLVKNVAGIINSESSDTVFSELPRCEATTAEPLGFVDCMSEFLDGEYDEWDSVIAQVEGTTARPVSCGHLNLSTTSNDEDIYENDISELDLIGLDMLNHISGTLKETTREKVKSAKGGCMKNHRAEGERSPDSTSGDMPKALSYNRPSIVRSPFPKQVEDRSPVIGIAANSVLRTCFRIGDALNTGCQAVRMGKIVVIDMYARVKSSWREGAEQRFVFSDLHHSKPPFMDGVFGSSKETIQSIHLASRFLDDEENEKMCRVIGSMRRKAGAKWEMIIRSVRETSWAEVEYVAGIYA